MGEWEEPYGDAELIYIPPSVYRDVWLMKKSR